MALLQESKALVGLLLLLCMTLEVSSHSRHMQYTPPNVTRLTDLFSPVSITQDFSTFFGGSNIKFLNNGTYANLALDKSSGISILGYEVSVSRLISILIFLGYFCRLWFGFKEQILLWLF